MKNILIDKKDWDSIEGMRHSGRCTPLGHERYIRFHKYVLIDKIVCVINKCPKCKSSNTFHDRCQKLRIWENVWRYERFKKDKHCFFKKFDYCLNCGNEFLIESFYNYKYNIFSKEFKILDWLKYLFKGKK